MNKTEIRPSLPGLLGRMFRPRTPENPFEKKIPPYLDCREAPRLTGEKKLYLEFIKLLTQEIDIPPTAIIAVLGVGAGFEVEGVARVLDSRTAGKGALKSVDISPGILASLKRNTASERVKNSLVQADALDLPFPDKSCVLVTMSSLLHEIQSNNGWSGVVKAFAEAERVLAPDGYLMIREFHPPFREEQILELKTPLANEFFHYFSSEFRNRLESEWRREWAWWFPWEDREENKNVINSTFIFEIMQHFRMFYKDYYLREGDKAFEFFRLWKEARERYTLAVPRRFSTDVEDIMRALTKAQKKLDPYAYTCFVFPDREDDGLLGQHFSISQLEPDGKEGKPYPFRTERMLIAFHKLPFGLNAEEREDAAMKAIDFLLRIRGKLLKSPS